MKRGDIVTAILPGSDGKPRPALVVQDDRFMEQASIVVAPFTTHLLDAADFRLRIDPASGTGLHQTCDLMLDKLSAVPREKLGAVVGALPHLTMREVSRLLILFLGLAPGAALPAPSAAP